MFWCDNCEIWEHEKCLADAIYAQSTPRADPHKKSQKSDIQIFVDQGEVMAARDQ